MYFDIITSLLVLALATLSIWALRKWYKYYHLSRAVLSYFFDQLPNQKILNEWFNWAELTTVKKLFGRLPLGGIPEPKHAQNYRTAPTARYEMERRLVEKHTRVAFADITDAVDLEARRNSLRYLREYFGCSDEA